MCIIITKEKGYELPPVDTIKTCFKRNPDGAGFMYSDGEHVHIRKGFANVDDLLTALNKIDDAKNKAIVIHCRISTQGGIKAELTHPYPLTNDLKSMRLLSCRCSLGIAHNGIIQATSDGASDYNDTMLYIKEYLTLLLTGRERTYYNNPAILDMIQQTIDWSRLAILDGAGHIERIGKGWEQDATNKGVFYSNSTYREYSYGGYGRKWYDDYYDDDYDYIVLKNNKTDKKAEGLTPLKDVASEAKSNDKTTYTYIARIDERLVDKSKMATYELFDTDDDLVDEIYDKQGLTPCEVLKSANKEYKQLHIKKRYILPNGGCIHNVRP